MQVDKFYNGESWKGRGILTQKACIPEYKVKPCRFDMEHL